MEETHTKHEGDRELLANLYNNVYEAIRNYKSLQWQVVILVVGMFAGIIGLAQSSTLSMMTKPFLQWLFSIFCVWVAVASTWFIHHTTNRLVKQRRLRRRIEDIFGFFNEGIYGQGSVLNSDWKVKPVSYWQDLGYLLSWWITIWVCTIFTLFVIWS